MSTRDADEIRCRTCFRVTPWAAFCTHCGAALPARQVYRTFEPEPEDALLRGAQSAREAAGPPAEIPALPDEPMVAPFTQPEPGPVAEREMPPSPIEPHDTFDPIDRFRAEAFSERELPEERARRGIGPLAIVAIVALGLMALGMGVVLSGVVSGLARATPTATQTPQPTATAAPSATIAPTPSSTVGPSLTPLPSGGPVVFPDGFTAVAQPCTDMPTSATGCDSSGASISATSLWIWVGYTHGYSVDKVVAVLIDATGSRLKENSISFATDLNRTCADPCNGWLRYRFTGLVPGNYTVWIERNGQLAATTAFTVSG
jgi:hypothetical protein